MSADVDYNAEAQGNPDNDIPTHIPVDGFYLKATNANAKASQADRVGWYISGAFKPNKIMSDWEARQKIDEWNADPKHKDLQVEYDFPRESGKVFNAETMQLEEPGVVSTQGGTAPTDVRYSFAKNGEEFDAIRDKAVTEVGTVMPNLAEKEVTIINVPRHGFTGTGRDAINKAYKWAEDNLVKEHTAKNGTSEEFNYIIDDEAVSKYLSSSSTLNSENLGVHLAVLTKLPNVIDNSIDAEIHPDYKKIDGVRKPENGVDDENLLVHRMYGAVRIDNNIYRVKTTMHEHRSEKNVPHDYRVTKIELIISGPSTDNALNSSTEKVENSTISGAKLLKGVEKSYDSGKKLLDESAETTENGEIRFSLSAPEKPALVKDYEERHEVQRWRELVSNISQHYKNRDIAALKRDRDAHANNAKYWARQLKRDLKNGFDDNDGFIKDYRAWVDMHNALSQYAKEALEDLTRNSWRNRSWGVKKNQSISMDEMDKMFAEHNTDSVNKDLWGRVMEVSRQLGVDNIKFNKTPKHVSGRILGGRVRFNEEFFNDPAHSDNDKCVTMLHEMIHHVTVYAIEHPKGLNEVQTNAVEELRNIYGHISKDPSFVGMYGIKNVKEMVAELANPRFREALRKKKLWYRIVDSIKRIFFSGEPGGEGVYYKTDAYAATLQNLVKLLENFNNEAYTQFADETRQYRPRFSLEAGETAAGVTLFSGGGLIESGLRGIVDPRAAVEYDKKIAGVYRDNHGNHIVTADVRDVDPMELAKQVDGPVEYFHASPVCKNFSVLKNGGEKPLDIETAQSTANAIDKMRPRIVTIENVANYQRSDALKVIADKLDELGYTHDTHIVDAADYGAATHRRRLILRAVAPGEQLPAFPEGDKESFTPWFDRVADLITDLPETDMPEWMTKRLTNDDIHWKSIDQPLIVMSSGAAYGGIGHAFADEAAPTIAAGRTGDRIVMPDGKVYKVTGRVLARLMGLPDSYKLPQSESLAHTVLGNGVPVELTRGVIGPLVKEVAQPSASRFSIAPTFYSNAERAVQNVKQEKAKAEQWKAMLTKAGGIKAGEDKWMGLSTWLDEHKGETLTKDEVAQFVADNGIEMEETHYGEGMTPEELFKRYVEDSGANNSDLHWTEWFDNRADGSIEFQGNQEERVETADLVNKKDDLVDPQNYDLTTSEGREEYISATEEELSVLAESQTYDDRRIINSTRLNLTTLGLENKREIAFVVPGVEPYQIKDEVHFGPENQGRAIMWVRFGETEDVYGNRVLVIDEIQSNRHQNARKVVGVDENGKPIREGYRDPNRFARETQQRGSREAALRGLLRGEFKITGIPDAPFESNWHEVAMKRMLRLAAEEGFDKVAWTTGEQQADRYDIRNVVEDLYYKKNEDGTYNISVQTKDSRGHGNGRYDDYGVQAFPNQSEADLANLLGKEIAQKIIDGKGRKGYTHNGETGWTTFKGNDLKIGGEGMKGFYDQMLPRFMDKYGKKWGVKTGEVTLDTPGGETMHSVDVTPEMRRSVMQGQPLFSLSNEYIDHRYYDPKYDEPADIKDLEEYNKGMRQRYGLKQGGAVLINNEQDLKRKVLDIIDEDETKLKQEIINKFRDKHVLGVTCPEYRMVLIFVNKANTIRLMEHNWWHENTHLAWHRINLPDKDECGLAALDYLKANVDDRDVLERELAQYTKEELPQEGGSRLFTFLFDYLGADKALVHKIDVTENFAGIEKVAKLVAEIQNYFRDETTRENDSSERTGQIRSEIAHRGSSSTSQEEADRGRSGGIPSQAEGSRPRINHSGEEGRFSLSGDGTVEEYNKAVNMTGRTLNVGGREVKPGITRYNFQEAFQNAILSVCRLKSEWCESVAICTKKMKKSRKKVSAADGFHYLCPF